jgi:rubrerythrin
MEEKKKQVVEGLMQAIKAERYGHTFYLMAARTTEDPKGKEVFEMLAHEELYHMHFLRNHYDSIIETGEPSMVEKLNSPADLTGVSPIFSDDLRGRIKDASFEMTCLSIGIRLEQDSMNFYRSQAATAENSEIKKFYGQLAEWESGHYQALLRQQEELKEDFWSEGGFAPF